jgi:hypothetical protein
MPYRRLPKTDAARLKALKTLLENNDIYTVRNRFIDWKLLNQAQPLYDRLLTANDQQKISRSSQVRFTEKLDRCRSNASMYLNHFLQVLFLSVERGEVKPQKLTLYGLPSGQTTLPNLKTNDGILKWGSRVIAGEKQRIKEGGRPIYNPTIGMVETHYDIFCGMMEKQKEQLQRQQNIIGDIDKLRLDIDETILHVWNQVETHYADLPPEERFNACRKFGVIYYYRRHEPHIY